MSQSETSPNNSYQTGPSSWLSKNKYILDAAVRILIVLMVFRIELVLLRELNHVTISESFGLLAAIVIVAFLLVLSLTLFKGSLEQDLQELKEDVSKLKDDDVHTLKRDVEDLKKDLKKLEGQIEKNNPS